MRSVISQRATCPATLQDTDQHRWRRAFAAARRNRRGRTPPLDSGMGAQPCFRAAAIHGTWLRTACRRNHAAPDQRATRTRLSHRRVPVQSGTGIRTNTSAEEVVTDPVQTARTFAMLFEFHRERNGPDDWPESARATVSRPSCRRTKPPADRVHGGLAPHPPRPRS